MKLSPMEKRGITEELSVLYYLRVTIAQNCLLIQVFSCLHGHNCSCSYKYPLQSVTDCIYHVSNIIFIMS